MLENLEGLDSILNPSRSLNEGLSDSQLSYLAELDMPDDSWAELNEGQQHTTESYIDARMEELGISVDQRSELAHQILSDDIADGYDDYLVDFYGDNSSESSELGIKYIEAPQDDVQIEQIREVLSDCDEIKYENWTSLELPEKESVLNSLEQRIAEIEHRPPCPVHLAPLGENQWGGYNPVTKDITINSLYAGLSDFCNYREVVDTLIHEGRHAYQDFNVNVAEVHPRHGVVESWADVMEGGKWGYWGDCSTLLGQRLYDQQSIEIDARAFAADILEKLNLNA